ncbi:hypothetical protein [Candidatus Protochlamydia amoebophila]|uniref:hypothetical protein n=1 Tax=Candidatus Protochlamydia amoebophila TaxID=362787 RepID=UPI001BC98F99|nr:hypothetical protein [Candidatus Protochlamydia amoebophila]
MSNINKHNDWKKWNQEGFIPGPEESEVNFKQRVAFCENLKQKFIRNTELDIPFDESDLASQVIVQEAAEETKQIYGIAPHWPPLFFNNYQLAPWHAGCAWIFRLDEQTPTAAFLQLRAQFKERLNYLGIYNRKELLVHELAHVGRMMYTEPQFEEILAYQSSHSRLRRFLGPIVQSSKESLLFILLLGVILVTNLALLMTDISLATTFMLGLQLIPIFFVGLALGRLFRKQYLINRCRKVLENHLPNKQVANHFLYRLLDSEIRIFACSSRTEMQTFIQNQAVNNFRWKFLVSLYPFKKE